MTEPELRKQAEYIGVDLLHSKLSDTNYVQGDFTYYFDKNWGEIGHVFGPLMTVTVFEKPRQWSATNLSKLRIYRRYDGKTIQGGYAT